MAKTANLYARIEPEVKNQAESILEALGIRDMLEEAGLEPPRAA